MEAKISALIDVTDRKFFIPANRAVLDYITKANPFAHSDIGAKLISLAKATPEVAFYCPNFRNCAFVALHDKSNRIFALAEGMNDLHFRLPLLEVETALSAGAARSEIGAQWIAAAAFAASASDWDAQLHRWCLSASTSFD